jgi:hypothetical protein
MSEEEKERLEFVQAIEELKRLHAGKEPSVREVIMWIAMKKVGLR